MALKLPLSILDWSRSIAGTPDINLVNRYFEQDPTNEENQCALLARPGLDKWIDLGTSNVRALYSQPGSFADSLFAVGDGTVFKIEQDETVSSIGTIGTTAGFVSMAATDTYLFIADGAALYSYTENDYARGTLTITGIISAAQTVVIGSAHYKFATDVTPYADGTSTSPWLVLVGGSAADSLQNLFDAINNSGAAGTAYSLAMIANPDAAASSVAATTLKVRANAPGTAGNSVATTETLANGSWGGAVLSGGGGTTFATVTVPDGDGIVSVGVIISFTICLVAPDPANPWKNGRWYFIRPGENTIEALDYETAERSPDIGWSVNVINDQFWIPGQNTIEVFQPTGDGDAPFERQQGRVFERGAWPGSIVSLGEAMMLVDSTGQPWEVTDAPQMIGTPGVIQRIREAINAKRSVS